MGATIPVRKIAVRILTKEKNPSIISETVIKIEEKSFFIL
jgi:hypothetical protein